MKKYTEAELQQHLRSQYPVEDSSCDWKEMKNLKNSFNRQEGDDVVSYVSGIANMEGGHLVIGVVDKTLDIVGTDISKLTFNGEPATTRSATFKLVEQCTNLSSEGLSIEEFLTSDTQKRVWVIHIPKHSPRLPVYAHKKAWQRIEDSLVELTKERRDAILSEPVVKMEDWSAQIVEGATIEDLDPKAIEKAKEEYIKVYPKKAEELKEWDNMTFLNKAKITRQGKITNAAIILVGKEESEHFISPAVCKIRWKLQSEDDKNKDFHIFSIPMIMAVDEITNTIRNTSYVYTIEGSMFPDTMNRYDVFTLREPLNNAIAHQDYSKMARIEIIEEEDEKLSFRNHGQFIPSSVEDVVNKDFPESLYRNPFLVEAMRNVNMVDTEGGGIRKLFMQQKKRFFPMPTYTLTDGMVLCEIRGKVLDENFARILVNNPELSLPEIILLDKVQKREELSDDAITYLRSKKFVEGRKSNLFLSFKVVNASKHVGLKATYIKNKSFDDSYYKELIINYVTTFKKASRSDIEELLNNKLPDILSNRQKYDKVTNLLASLRKERKLKVEGRKWVLVNG